jgi:K+-sensing histidine kinase KdpD
VDISEGATLYTDRLMFSRIIGNPTENTVEYPSFRDRIECNAEQGPAGTFNLKNSNSITSLGPHDWGMIFQPFWRKGSSRANSRRSGPGLALVREYAKVLGITVTASLLKTR